MTSADLDLRLSPVDQRLLLTAAAEAIAGKLLDRPATVAAPTRSRVDEQGASFVTLRAGDDLLGCIGSLEPRRALLADVAANAEAAAFADPRLPSVTATDYRSMSITVSVLSPLAPMAVADHEELTSSLSEQHTGLLVVAGLRRGTFLPSVWKQLPTAPRFLEALWHKAGLRPREWPRDLQLWRYATVEFTDEGPRSLA